MYKAVGFVFSDIVAVALLTEILPDSDRLTGLFHIRDPDV
jgi:hypothetical protein